MSGWTTQKAHLKRIRDEKKEAKKAKKATEIISSQDKQHSNISIQCDLSTRM